MVESNSVCIDHSRTCLTNHWFGRLLAPHNSGVRHLRLELHMYRYLLAAALLAVSTRTLADTYVVECTDFLPDCSKIIVENTSAKFIGKFPPSDWKIIVPTARVFRMGNGSLQSYFDVAVVPRATELPENPNAYSNFIRKLKKKYASAKNGRDIAGIGNPAFEWRNGEMFEDAKFRKAGLILMAIMAREATQKMMDECASTADCDVYEP